VSSSETSALEAYFPYLVGGFITFAITFAAIIYKKRDDIFEKTRHQSSLTTINVGNIQEQMKEIKKMNDDLKEHFDDRLDKIERENKSEFKDFREQLSKISTESYNLGWRVGELEDRLKTRGGRSNGSGGAVM
jgi:chromosome segregation ATPase